MKATLKEQPFRLHLKVMEARISQVQDVNPETVRINVAFLATHWVRTETVDEVETEVATPMSSPILVDESQHNIPLDLWVGLRKCISNHAMLPGINEALSAFNALFQNSMAGFQLEIDSIQMG